MTDNLENITIYLHESGPLKAFADVALQTPYGEIILKGCRIVQKAGQAPWVGFPTISYVKGGQTKYKDLIETSQVTKRKLAEAILAAYHNALNASEELSARPQRSDG
jgi:DNA-binding cell septation regulator SpoVG